MKTRLKQLIKASYEPPKPLEKEEFYAPYITSKPNGLISFLVS